MINRILIRLKIVQLLYAYYQNKSTNIETAEKELLFSLSKAYDLYNYLLMLMIAVTRYALQRVEQKEKHNEIIHSDEVVSHKFVDNKFIMQLEANKQLQEFRETQKKTWDNDADYVKYLYDTIVSTGFYNEYMSSGESSYAEDRERLQWGDGVHHHMKSGFAGEPLPAISPR